MIRVPQVSDGLHRLTLESYKAYPTVALTIKPVTEPFAQPERRSFLLPVLLALGTLTIAAAVVFHLFPATQVQATHLQTVLHPEDTTFKSNSIVLGQDHTEHILYIASTIRIDNRLRLPITLDDFTLTFTNPDAAQLTAKAFTKPELANIQLTYPALKPLLTAPLLTDTPVTPGQSTQGTLLFALPVPQSMWDQRKSAIIEVALYHQPPVSLTIPKP